MFEMYSYYNCQFLSWYLTIKNYYNQHKHFVEIIEIYTLFDECVMIILYEIKLNLFKVLFLQEYKPIVFLKILKSLIITVVCFRRLGYIKYMKCLINYLTILIAYESS